VEDRDLAARLAAPFDPSEVKFKAQTVSGNRALAVPFVDARVVQDRLDDAVGTRNWQDSYECLPDGAVVCTLRVRFGEEWITKADVGAQSEQPDEGDRRKAAFSDALKRAAVKFGVGRYLYRQRPQWVDYDPQKRQFLRQPSLPGAAPPPAPRPEAKEEARPAPEPISLGQVKELSKLMARTTTDPKTFCAFYSKRSGWAVRDLAQLPASQYEHAREKLTLKLNEQKAAKAGKED
jgi:hypothetical protein